MIGICAAMALAVLLCSGGKADAAQAGDINQDGTVSVTDTPIILTAEDPENPPVLTGSDIAHGYVLHIKGSYWDISYLHCTNAQKRIVLDNSNYSVE